MTYVTKRSGARPRHARPQSLQRRAGAGSGSALGGNWFFDDILEPLVYGVGAATRQVGREISCSSEAEASLGTINAQIEEAKQWHPTGFFTPDDLLKVWDATISAISAAADQLVRAPNADSDEVRELLNDLSVQGEKGTAYAFAVAKARKEGVGVINSPGIKIWVVQSLEAIRSAARKTTFLNCNMSWLEEFSRAANAAIDVVIKVLRFVVGVVVAAGQQVVNAVDFTFQVIRAAKWAAIAGVGYVVFRKIQERRRGV